MDFAKIDSLRLQLKKMRPPNQAELQRLKNEFIIENTYNSNAIEGSTLTLRETALILQDGITIAEKPIKEHLEAIGHKDAFEYINQLAAKQKPLTERAIKEIHSLVLMNDAANRGKYRNIPVMIMGAEHTPPPPYLVPEAMQKLIAGYNQPTSKHIIEAVSEFHLRFEGIHPFVDGNGRTGRLILNLELIKAGLLPINIKFADRRKYYDCFDSFYANNQDPIMLVELIAEYEKAELEKYIAIIQNS